MRARAETAYAIGNPKGLRQLLGRMVQELGAGSETAAAAAIGISQPTLNRLRNGKRSTISARVANRLQAAAAQLRDGKASLRTFTEVVLNPGIARILEVYFEWELKAAGSARLPKRDTWYPTTKPLPPGWVRDHTEASGPSIEANDLDWLLWRMKEEAPREFKRLERRLRSQTILGARLRALRIFEPLFHHHDSFFIERGPHELSGQEFIAFVRAGVTRELILLNRPAAPRRALDVQAHIGAREGLW